MDKLPDFAVKSWNMVALSRHVKRKPVRRQIGGTAIVLFRDGDHIQALIDRCPHRAFPLSEGRIEGGQIECPYHGWRFDGAGRCTETPGCPSPSSAKAAPVTVAEKYGGIFVKLGTDGPDSPPLPPLMGDPDHDHFWWAQGVWQGRAFDAIENVLDPFHTNYIHHGFIRHKARRRDVTLIVDAKPDQIEMIIEQDAPDKGLMSRFLERDRSRSFSRFLPPSIVLAQWEGQTKLTLSVAAFFTPETEDSVRPFACFTTPKGLAPGWLKQAAIRLFLAPVVAQDRRALATQMANIKRFGDTRFAVGPGDLLGTRTETLYRGDTIEPAFERTENITL